MENVDFINDPDAIQNNDERNNNEEKHSTVESLMKHFGTWAGGKEDAEKVLKYILNNRDKAEFFNISFNINSANNR
jgi:hypothetical protein